MDDERSPALTVESVFAIINDPSDAPIWVIADHAGAAVPDGLELGVSESAMRNHIACDWGVAEVADFLCENRNFAAFKARYSRLVVDLNRDRSDPAAIPLSSDGIPIPANKLSSHEAEYRLKTYHDTYHDVIAATLRATPPRLILSLHSFTPALSSDPEQARPWHIGVLYNRHAAASKRAIELLRKNTDWCVGDQEPYSGAVLNATMNRHAEANTIPYIGIEMRQDCIADAKGQRKFAQILSKIALQIQQELATGAII